MKARVSHLHKTAADWEKHNNWVPEAGEFVIYDPDSTIKYARIKVGDGKRKLSDLDFFIDSTALNLMQQAHFFDILDGGRIGK